MSTLTIENATILVKSEVRRGSTSKGTWSSQEFVVEYMEGQYPAKAVFSVFGDDKVNNLARFRIGERVNVSFNLSAREYNGRWFGENRAWKIEAVADSSTPRRGTAPQAASQPAPQPTNHPFTPAGEDEDLPF